MSIHYYSRSKTTPHTLIMELNMQAYFDQLDRVRFEGTKNDQSFSISSLQPG
ncbi:Xylose isomerase [Enterobacter hormaechei]|nr:Xylose isomerase [Enterobacter hormaechei]